MLSSNSHPKPDLDPDPSADPRRLWKEGGGGTSLQPSPTPTTVTHPGWGWLYIPVIIASIAAATKRATSKYLAVAPGSPGSCIYALNGTHLLFVCGLTMENEVSPIMV